MDFTDNKNDSQKNVKVLTMQDEIFGLPSSIIILGISLILIFYLTINFLSGLIVAFLYFPSLYYLYRNDSRILTVIKRNLFRNHSYWSTNINKKNIVYIIWLEKR